MCYVTWENCLVISGITLISLADEFAHCLFYFFYFLQVRKPTVVLLSVMLSKKILEITLVQLLTHFLLPLMYLCHLVRLSSSNIVGYLKPGFFGTRPDLNPTFDIYLLLTFLCQCNSDVLVRDPKIQTTAGKTGFFGTRTRLLLLDYLSKHMHT